MVRPRQAAAVILIRARIPGGEAEVFLVRRHAASSFMARSFVFPGGTVDEDDRDRRETAARELLEETGVLLADGPVTAPALAAARLELSQGGPFARVLERTGARLARDRLYYFARWITPSVEPKRFEVVFFVAELPPGQTPSFDDTETVAETWVTPSEALARAGELRLPPPQVRTMYDLSDAATAGPEAVIALASERSRRPRSVLPKAVCAPSSPGGFALLLPWDPDYQDAPGEGEPIPLDHPLAQGPSRLVLSANGWKLVDPPTTTGA